MIKSMEKYGIVKLGWVRNIKRNPSGQNCFDYLSQMVRKPISQKEIDDFIESGDCKIKYYDANGVICEECDAIRLTFNLPYTDRSGNYMINGVFTRETTGNSFVGVKWEWAPCIQNYCINNPGCIQLLRNLSNCQNIDTDNIESYIASDVTYLNGAGCSHFQDGTDVNSDTSKFARFETTLRTATNEEIFGWLTKNIKGNFDGVDWGTLQDFEYARKNRESFFLGRMTFNDQESCECFLESIVKKSIPEPWTYKDRTTDSKYPILRSYIMFELDRLFYEKEELKWNNKLLYNKSRNKVLFNTNLIDKFGHDLNIVGDLKIIGGKEYVSNPQVCSSTLHLKKIGFESMGPTPPRFFNSIDEICFHCDWDIDSSIERYEHIIEERIGRFPEKYQEMGTDDLGHKIDNAIKFAKRIAQRNYKFIVPMYYPVKNRIQLLMPIYLDSAYTDKPDFALVLTPHASEKVYTPETILGLDEVYQDARLVAKPEESWLKL